MLLETVILVILLVITAALLKGGFAFSVLYLFLGVYIIGMVWTRQTAKSITCDRKLESHVFLGEEIHIRLEIKNSGWLPVPWLFFYESLPSDLAAGSAIQRVLSLKPHSSVEVPYTLNAYKRGYYAIGPFNAKFGDTIGLTGTQEIHKQLDYITVYPRIVALDELKMPSRSPLGTLRYHQPIFEDPSRVRGKRDYVTTDSLRMVDWKATAAAGRLQVKQFEPSIALQTAIFLDLNINEYHGQRLDAAELSIVIAASVANWVVKQKQSVGLITNGRDPSSAIWPIKPLPPRKGGGHLIHILDLLARIQKTDTLSLAELLNKETPNLPWGTTVIIVTGHADETLFDELFEIKRRGQSVMLLLSGYGTNIRSLKLQAERFGIPFYAFQNEKSLEAWGRR